MQICFKWWIQCGSFDVKVNVVGEDYVKNWNEMLTYAQEIDEVRIKRMRRRNKSI